MFSARVKDKKKAFCIVLAEKQQKCHDRAPLSKDRQGQRRQQQELHFTIVPSRVASKLLTILELNWNERFGEGIKMKILLLSVHTTAMQLISGLENENYLSQELYCFIAFEMRDI